MEVSLGQGNVGWVGGEWQMGRGEEEEEELKTRFSSSHPTFWYDFPDWRRYFPVFSAGNSCANETCDCGETGRTELNGTYDFAHEVYFRNLVFPYLFGTLIGKPFDAHYLHRCLARTD